MCVTEVVRVVGRVMTGMSWAVEKIGGAELEADIGVNGGEEIDD